MGYCPLGTHGSDGPGEDFHATLAFIVSLGAVASLTAQLFPPFFLSFESPLYAKYIIEEQAEYILHVSKYKTRLVTAAVSLLSFFLNRT